MSRFLPVVPTIEQRIESLENQFENVKNEKGVPGPRGPAGPIEAAVINATRAATNLVADAESRVQARADTAYAQLKEEAARLRLEVQQLKVFLNDRIHNEVDGQVVKTLQEYHLLDENCAPTHWSK
jgi:hypothetical protein